MSDCTKTYWCKEVQIRTLLVEANLVVQNVLFFFPFHRNSNLLHKPTWVSCFTCKTLMSLCSFVIRTVKAWDSNTDRESKTVRSLIIVQLLKSQQTTQGPSCLAADHAVCWWVNHSGRQERRMYHHLVVKLFIQLHGYSSPEQKAWESRLTWVVFITNIFPSQSVLCLIKLVSFSNWYNC